MMDRNSSNGEIMNDEIWKPVTSLSGYMASSWGRVKLPEKEVVSPTGGRFVKKTKPRYGSISRASKTAKHKYMDIKTDEHGHLKVHRLVCEAFHGPPPKGKNVVLHINEDATDNRPENLKWGTQKENLNSPKFIEYCKSRTGENNPFVKGRKTTR